MVVKSRQKREAFQPLLTLPSRLDVSHDVIRSGHAESKDAFGLEVERLHFVLKPLLALAFLGDGQKFGLETGDQIRGKLGAVVANPLD